MTYQELDKIAAAKLAEYKRLKAAMDKAEVEASNAQHAANQAFLRHHGVSA